MPESTTNTADGVPIRVLNTEHGFGNHAKGWEPTSRDAEAAGAAGADAVAEVAKSRALLPTDADKRAAFGAPQRLPDGTMGWRVDMKDPKQRGLHFELTRAWRDHEKRRCGQYNAAPKVTCVDPRTGRQELVFESDADRVMRKRGLREARSSWRGARHVGGPDGMLFRWEGETLRFRATGRRCLGTPIDDSDPTAVSSPQRDPEGRVWIEFEHGDWRLVDDLVGGDA